MMIAVSISEILKDPAWWFTSVFIALLISVLASVAVIYIPKLFGRFSESLRKRKERSEKFERLLIQVAADEPTYYISSFFRLILRFFVVVLLFAFSLAISPLHEFYQNHPEYDPFGRFIPELSDWIIGSVGLLYMILVIISGYQISGEARILHKVHAEFRSRIWKKIEQSMLLPPTENQQESPDESAATIESEAE